MTNNKFNYRRALIIGVIGIGVASVGHMYLSSLYLANQISTCKTETQEKIGKVAEEWDDVMSRAKTSNRSNMQANISDLQNIKRRFNDVKVPQCAIVAKITASNGMQSDIRQLLEFTKGDDKTYIKSFAWKIFADETKEIASSGKSMHENTTDDSAKRIVGILIDEKMKNINNLIELPQKQFLEYQAKSKEIIASDSVREAALTIESDPIYMLDSLKLQYKDVIENYKYLLTEKNNLEADKSLL
jgi:hypothetical protein